MGDVDVVGYVVGVGVVVFEEVVEDVVGGFLVDECECVVFLCVEFGGEVVCLFVEFGVVDCFVGE